MNKITGNILWRNFKSKILKLKRTNREQWEIEDHVANYIWQLQDQISALEKRIIDLENGTDKDDGK